LSDTAGDAIARPADAASLSALGLSALGVVFGDIGTSPLYTLKTVLGLTGGGPDSVVTLGVLSLVFQHRGGTPPINCRKILSCLADLFLGRGPDRRRLGPHHR